MTPISPPDAFRLVLQSTCPQRPGLADEIYGYGWFHHKTIAEQSREDFKAAKAALEKLTGAIKDGQVRLVGSLKNDEPPLEIPLADIAIGQLDIWKQHFECFMRESIDRTYRAVFLDEADVRAVANGTERPEMQRELKQAPSAQIHLAIKEAYDAAEDLPPNINKLASVVLPILKRRGLTTSAAQVKIFGADDRHKRRRRRVGVRTTPATK